MVTKKDYKEFFTHKKYSILTQEEFDLISEYCNFSLQLPESGHDCVTVTITTNEVLPQRIFDKLVNNTIPNLEIVVNSKNPSSNYEQIHEYIKSFLKTCHPDSYTLKEVLTPNNITVSDQTIFLKYVTQTDKNAVMLIEKELLLYLSKVNFNITKIEYVLDTKKRDMMLEAEQEKRKMLEQTMKISYGPQDPLSRYKGSFVVRGDFTNLSEIDQDDIGLTLNVKGELAIVESRDAKKNPNIKLYKFVIYDYANGALTLTYSAFKTPVSFSTKVPKMPVAYLDAFKEGQWVNANITIQSNKYTNFELQGSINRIYPIEMPSQFVVSDDAQEKRVELLCHSNMSAFDGIKKPSTIYKFVKKQGYKAIGILERNNVQSIPAIAASQADSGIKPLYGCEFEMIDKFIPVVVNPVDANLSQASYVIFDIETTGLYPQYDDLLEFGAIRWKNGQIVDRVDFFAKPTKPLTPVAINMSHITNDMVANGLSQKEALIKIKEWIKDDVLIAHNGIRFDLSFLNKLCERFNVEPIKNALIDTLVISHSLNTHMGRHNLGTLTRKLRIDYNELEAHRADKDSEYLLAVWQYFLKQLLLKGINNVNEINNKLQNAALKANRRGYIVDVYVKNEAGIKDLFKLVSKSLTTQLYQRDDDQEEKGLTNGQPKIHYEDLVECKDNIIIAPSPYEGEIWESALTDTQEELERKIKLYDYIFVAPAKNAEHYVKQEKLTKAYINDALTKIVNTCKKLDKKVCAVSDCYYLYPNERIIHEIYVYTKQLGGARHRLYRHDGSTYVPDFHFMTTNEMLEAFNFLKDKELAKEIVVTNTNKFADEINEVHPIKDGLNTPKIENAENMLIELVNKTAKEKYGQQLDKAIADRIDKELSVIVGHGYSVIYWISHLLVKKTNEDGYPVGSRGSVGSSLVAFLANISEVNPLAPHYVCKKCHHFEWAENAGVDGFDLPHKKCPVCGEDMFRDGHNIPFESFLGSEGRPKIPDIDLNFSGEYQGKAHNFIRDMFGEAYAFRAGTIGTVAQKTAFGYVKSYFEQKDPNSNPSNSLVDVLAKKCEGVKRTTGQHPGGIVIVPQNNDILNFCPYNYPSNDKNKDWFTTHFDFHSIDKNLLKFDILGHDEPTILKHLEDSTGVKLETIPYHDDKVMELFADSKALGVVDDNYDTAQLATMALPEFGTSLTKRIVEKTKPLGVADLIRISGLSHGTGVWKDNAEDLITDGAQLQQLICCREDIVYYLTQCGVSFTDAFNIMEKIRKGKGVDPKFEQMMIQANVPKWYINSCKKIKYLFPKAHAAAYVIDALRTAYFKVYYPVHFYAAWFSARTAEAFDIENIPKGTTVIKGIFEDYKSRLKTKDYTKKLKVKEENLIPIYEVALEMFARGINMLNIDLNKSDATQFLPEGNDVRPPFTALDGLGAEAAKSIIEARKIKPFSSISDLEKRTKLSTTLIGKLQDLGVLNGLDDDEQMRLF